MRTSPAGTAGRRGEGAGLLIRSPVVSPAITLDEFFAISEQRRNQRLMADSRYLMTQVV